MWFYPATGLFKKINFIVHTTEKFRPLEEVLNSILLLRAAREHLYLKTTWEDVSASDLAGKVMLLNVSSETLQIQGMMGSHRRYLD